MEAIKGKLIGKGKLLDTKEELAEGLTPEGQKAILGKEAPKENKHQPPAGIEAFQMFRDGSHWSVWAFRVKEGGDIETEKVLEREVYEVAKMRVGLESIKAQMRSVQ